MKYAPHPTQSSVSSLAEVTGLAWTSELARKKVKLFGYMDSAASRQRT